VDEPVVGIRRQDEQHVGEHLLLAAQRGLGREVRGDVGGTFAALLPQIRPQRGGPRIAMWSRAEPLTLFGAAISGRGWGEIGPIFDRLGKQFSNCLSYQNEIVAAEARGDLAYTVALEHTTASINGADPKPYVLRATTIFRREDGEWKVVHRHGDALAADSAVAVNRLR
jgi:ketosteroid isomerase-like protein